MGWDTNSRRPEAGAIFGWTMPSGKQVSEQTSPVPKNLLASWVLMGRDETVRRQNRGLRKIHDLRLNQHPYLRRRCSASYIRMTSITSGSAAELAASRKVTKYAHLPVTHNFIPIATESLGLINKEGLDLTTELGRRVKSQLVTHWSLHSAHLFQRFSICTQRHSAIAF